ncbi:DUF3127 domain-containing protein [Sporocytophaga myxococcoides]|uniref:DUF3127 domain-containing protein n=1 Tax=Sporocytophaga myxococcoides TaxID=153721 RepID=UPI0004130E24|nr:DUF3127 domain-containing protein [Sporocytophaga myxococcoides]
MALELTGKVVKILPEQTGSGKNGNWVKQEFVIETTNEQYPKKVCCSAWGDKAGIVKNLKSGDEVKVGINIESREYNERWYTDVRAWKIDTVGGGGQSSDEPSGGYAFGADSGESADDLPF